MKRQCEWQIGVRPRLWLNVMTIPYAVVCPHSADQGSHYCDRHSSRWVSIDPDQFDRWQVDGDGFGYRVNDLPGDQWQCSECSQPVGLVLHESDYGAASLRWVTCFAPRGSDVLTNTDRLLCEDCVPEWGTR